MKKTTPKNPSSEPICEDSSPIAAKLKKLIRSGRWLEVKRMVRKKRLPPGLEAFFLDSKVPKKLLKMYVRGYQLNSFLTMGRQPDQSYLLHFVRDPQSHFSLIELRRAPKGRRYLVMEIYYQNHDITAEEELNLFGTGRPTEITIYLKFHIPSINAALKLIERGLIGPITQMAKKELPEEVYEAMKQSDNPQIVALTKKAIYKSA